MFRVALARFGKFQWGSFDLGVYMKAVSLVRRGQGKELTQAAFEVFCVYL